MTDDEKLAEAAGAVVKVGDGRGFIIADEHRRLVVTAAHCLPHLPPAHPGSSLEERTYANLLGALDDQEPTVWAECLFADPVADIAVLGAPDGQELYDENEAYEAMTEARPVLQIGGIPRTDLRTAVLTAGIPAWVLQLDGRWTDCAVRHVGGQIWIVKNAERIEGGMSGSPIVNEDGLAIGAISTGNGPNPRLLRDLPMWLAPR